jgi:Tol biopolymer transport system component
MTDRAYTELDLRRWLDAAGQTPMPTDIDDLLTRTARARQRPAWSFPERWLPVNVAIQAPIVAGRRPSLRATSLVALLILALAAGAVLVAGSQRRVPPPFGPATNGIVAYVAADGNVAFDVGVFAAPFGDIATVDPKTGATTILVPGPTRDGYPVFSLDGTQIAFTRDTRDGQLLYVVGASGGEPQALTAPLQEIRDAAWSPDGSSIAFTAREGDRWHLWVAHLDGRDAERVELDQDLSVGLPQWRPPDGHELLVLASTSPGLLSTAGYRGLWGGDDAPQGRGIDLYLVRSDGSTPTRVTDVDGSGFDFAHTRWSQDGQTIVTQLSDPLHNLRVRILAADGTEHQVIAPDRGIETMYPEVSPDGRHIAFADMGADQAWRLRVTPIDGSSAPFDVAEFGGGAASYAWSPDGRSIIVTHHYYRETWLVDVDARTKSKVSWVDPGDPAWQRTAD